MAFNFNGTTPTVINYNGTDITVLKYSQGGTTTAVWGKPYSLSITIGANTTVTVNRTSSPNMHASTGTLSSGSTIYYGDVLTISASANSGYNLSTFTVNGTAWTSGNTITVTSAIAVVTVAESSAGWHTLWTGSLTDTSTSLTCDPYGSASDWFTVWTQTTIPSNTQKLRVTGTVKVSVITTENTFTLTNKEISKDGKTLIGSVSSGTAQRPLASGDFYLGFTISPSKIKSYATLGSSSSRNGILAASVTLTKVEVYY